MDVREDPCSTWGKGTPRPICTYEIHHSAVERGGGEETREPSSQYDNYQSDSDVPTATPVKSGNDYHLASDNN